MRHLLLASVIALVLLPQVGASTASSADPSGDEKASTLGIPLSSALNCHDPAADIVETKLTSDAVNLTVTLRLNDVYAAPSCEPAPGHHLPFIWRCCMSQSVGLSNARFTITLSTLAYLDLSRDQAQHEWEVCDARGNCVLNDSVHTISNEVVWSIPLAGELRGAGTTATYDLRGESFSNVLFEAQASESDGPWQRLNEVAFTDFASIPAFTV